MWSQRSQEGGCEWLTGFSLIHVRSLVCWALEPPFCCRWPCGHKRPHGSLCKCPCVSQASIIGCCLPVSPRVIPSSISVYPGTVGFEVCVAVFTGCLMSSLCCGAPLTCQCAAKCVLWMSDCHGKGCISVTSHACRPMSANVSMSVSLGITSPIAFCMLGLSL